MSIYPYHSHFLRAPPVQYEGKGQPSDGFRMNKGVAKLDALTGLRFLAAFAVFIHHVQTRLKVELINGPLGAFAVSFFFVLSGFILTYVYHNRLEKGQVGKFYFTRFARIWPLHAICLAAVFVLFPRQMHAFEAPYEQLKIASHWLLLQSWVPNHSWVFTFNGVSWSISTEMFFYLMFPLLLIGGQKKFWRKYALVVLLTAIALVSIRFITRIPAVTDWVHFRTLVHINPAMRLIEFASGMATGYLFLNRTEIRKPRSFLADTCLETVSMIVVCGHYFVLRDWGFYGFLRATMGPDFSVAMVYTGGTLFYAFAIYVFARSNGLWGRLFSTRSAVFLGEISFAFYMCHQLVLRWAFGNHWVGSNLSVIELAIGCALVAIGISTLLFLLVEIPAKNGLLKLYDRDWRGAWSAVAKPARQFATSKMAVITVLLLVTPVLYFEVREDVAKQNPSVVEIVNQTEPQLRDIQFGEDIQLVGYSLEPRRMGVQMNLVWKKLSNRRTNRHIYFCEPGGRSINSLRLNNIMFKNREIGDLMVERVFIHRNKYKQAFAIAVGFDSPKNGPVLAQRGPRTSDMQKLYVIRKARLASLESGTPLLR